MMNGRLSFCCGFQSSLLERFVSFVLNMRVDVVAILDFYSSTRFFAPPFERFQHLVPLSLVAVLILQLRIILRGSPFILQCALRPWCWHPEMVFYWQYAVVGGIKSFSNLCWFEWGLFHDIGSQRCSVYYGGGHHMRHPATFKSDN